MSNSIRKGYIFHKKNFCGKSHTQSKNIFHQNRRLRQASHEKRSIFRKKRLRQCSHAKKYIFHKRTPAASLTRKKVHLSQKQRLRKPHTHKKKCVHTKNAKQHNFSTRTAPATMHTCKTKSFITHKSRMLISCSCKT